MQSATSLLRRQSPTPVGCVMCTPSELPSREALGLRTGIRVLLGRDAVIPAHFNKEANAGPSLRSLGVDLKAETLESLVTVAYETVSLHEGGTALSDCMPHILGELSFRTKLRDPDEVEKRFMEGKAQGRAVTMLDAIEQIYAQPVLSPVSARIFRAVLYPDTRNTTGYSEQLAWVLARSVFSLQLDLLITTGETCVLLTEQASWSCEHCVIRAHSHYFTLQVMAQSYTRRIVRALSAHRPIAR